MTDRAQTLGSVDPRATAAYLRLHGWDIARTGDLGDRWQLRTEGRVRNVAVPKPGLDQDDRALMLSTVLKVLEEVEHRPADSIVRDLRDGGSDILQFRVIAPALAAGEIPLHAAPEMLQGALDAISSAGRAEVQPRAFYTGGQIPAQVRTFLEQARVAPSEKGSVILNIRSAVDPVPLAQTSIVTEAERPPSEVPFERRALRRLFEAVRAAKTTVHREAVELITPDALDDDIEAGLSANLCDALTDLAGDKAEIGGQLEVAVRWSLFVPSDEVETRIEIRRPELNALRDVAERLRDIRPLENRHLSGYVRELNRPPGERDGTVRVVVDLDGKSSVVRLHLEESDYRTAIRAHDQNLELSFTGTLEKAGKIWEVVAPTAVTLSEN